VRFCADRQFAKFFPVSVLGGRAVLIKWFVGDETEYDTWSGVVSLRGATMGRNLVPPSNSNEWRKAFVRDPSNPTDMVLWCSRLTGTPCVVYEITRSGDAHVVCDEDLGLPRAHVQIHVQGMLAMSNSATIRVVCPALRRSHDIAGAWNVTAHWNGDVLMAEHNTVRPEDVRVWPVWDGSEWVRELQQRREDLFAASGGGKSGSSSEHSTPTKAGADVEEEVDGDGGGGGSCTDAAAVDRRAVADPAAAAADDGDHSPPAKRPRPEH
jgi:hypothetical protein